MTAKEITQIRRWIGQSGDDKPANQPPGSTFLEANTAKIFTFDGSEWRHTDSGRDILGSKQLATIIEAGVGGTASASYDDDTSEAKIELLAAGEEDRAVLVIVTCTETLAGDEDLPTFQIGEEDGDADKFFALGHGETIDSASEGDVFVAAGTLTSGKAMQITVVENDGTAGAVDIVAIALPVAQDGGD